MAHKQNEDGEQSSRNANMFAPETRSDNLDTFLNDLKQLPSAINQNFACIRDLDMRALDTMRDADHHANNYLHQLTVAPSACDDREKIKALDLYKKALKYSDDKVKLSQEFCKLVDKQIRQLDEYMGCHEAFVKNRAFTNSLTNKEVPPSCNVGKRSYAATEMHAPMEEPHCSNSSYMTCKKSPRAVTGSGNVGCSNAEMFLSNEKPQCAKEEPAQKTINEHAKKNIAVEQFCSDQGKDEDSIS